MNKFQKDLNLINNKITDNRKEKEELEQKKNVLSNENINLNLSMYEVTREINDLIIYRKRIKENNANIKKIEKNNNKIFILYVLFLLIVSIKFGIVDYNYFSHIIYNVLGVLVAIGGITLNNNKISSLKHKNKHKYKGYSVKDINQKLISLENKKQYLLDCIKSNEEKLDELNKEIDKINENYANLRSDYNILLEYYQNIVGQFDISEKEEVMEEVINDEYTKALPIMLKKLYSKNND